MALSRRLLAIASLLPLWACQSPFAADPMDGASHLSELPTPLAQLQTATILDVELYRPSAKLAGCNERPIPEAAPSGRLEQALAAADAYSREHGGLGFAVLRDGALIYESYSPGMDAMRPTVSASMAKSVLGLVVGIALEEGLVTSVNDQIGLYLPEWRSDPRGEIELRHLLTMSAGLGRYDAERFLSIQDSGGVLLEMEQAGPPGDQFAYSNAVSQLLAIIIDRQARAYSYQGYADYLQKKLWCPLGNRDAELWVDPLGMPRAYAGLHAGLHDWARLGELVRNKGYAGAGQIVPAQWIGQMTRPSAINPQYGYHIWLGGAWTSQRRYSQASSITITHSKPFVAPDIAYFDGFGGQRVYVLPSQGLTIVRTGLTSLAYDDAIIPNLLVRAVD